MNNYHRAELIYRGFDPAFEELVGFWGGFYKLDIKYTTPVFNESGIVIEMKGHKVTFTKRLNRLVKTIRSKKIRGKQKEFTVWRDT